ncbi:methyltransferase domain-containing protein [Candidatus Kaiserbacteria bacterium]|nr:methyltransferase domain-containing protein [Candidatus Kaiserbacteria bacterium]
MMSRLSDNHTSTFAHPPSHIAEMNVAPGMVVVDFGAGSGAHVFPLAEAIGRDGHVYAVDIQRDLLTRIKNEARRRDLHHVDVLWGDIEVPGGSKIADTIADIVLLSNVLFQLSDKHAALSEARRILKPTGLFAIIERNGAPGILHRESAIQKEDVLARALKAKFEPVREFYAGSHHYGILFRPIFLQPPRV